MSFVKHPKFLRGFEGNWFAIKDFLEIFKYYISRLFVEQKQTYCNQKDRYEGQIV